MTFKRGFKFPCDRSYCTIHHHILIHSTDFILLLLKLYPPQNSLFDRNEMTIATSISVTKENEKREVKKGGKTFIFTHKLGVLFL